MLLMSFQEVGRYQELTEDMEALEGELEDTQMDKDEYFEEIKRLKERLSAQ